MAAIGVILVVSLVTGALTGVLANCFASPGKYFHDCEHFTECEFEGGLLAESESSSVKEDKESQEESSDDG